MTVGTGNEAAQLHFWEHINQNFFAVHCKKLRERQQVFSTFSSPCIGVKPVHNYEHRRLNPQYFWGEKGTIEAQHLSEEQSPQAHRALCTGH
jgi:hypothetical protein